MAGQPAHDTGIVGRTFHDLRGTAVLMLNMAGATEAEIATVTGHSLRDVRSILDKRYFHRSTRLADAGMDKLDAMIVAMAARDARRHGPTRSVLAGVLFAPTGRPYRVIDVTRRPDPGLVKQGCKG